MRIIACAALLSLLCAAPAQARIDGVTGPSFQLTARTDQITTGDGNSLLIWGYALGPGRAQYPGPTLIVQQGQTVTVALTNALTQPVSIVFPGQDVTASTTTPSLSQAGLLTREALPGGTVTYAFTASRPGTYVYYSGTDSALQVEMGLTGALIVRPTLGDKYAYDSAATQFDQEYLFALGAMDPRIHQTVAFRGVAGLAATGYLADYKPNYFFLNGRTFPETVQDPFAGHLPTQPYNSLPLIRPGERVLLRFAGIGRVPHPLHTHGNHSRVIAKQGRLLETVPGTLDLSHFSFTVNTLPGETVDSIFVWNGKGLGWDIYGAHTQHSCNGRPVTNTTPAPGEPEFDPTTNEYCADHGKPFPVTLPETQFTTLGPFYSGTPFMGAIGALPPGEGGLNPWGGYPFMWHSHNERELTNWNIFPGGMITMMIVVPPGTPVP